MRRKCSRILSVVLFCLSLFDTAMAAEWTEAMTDPDDRETFQWLLERADAVPEIHYRRDQVEWIAFKDHPLEYMRLAGSPFDGDGLRAVAQIITLKTLNVFHTAVTDDDVAALRGHPNLQEVVVGPMWDNKITNKTVEHVAADVIDDYVAAAKQSKE